MYDAILLAAALQRWDRYSAHAVAAREVAAAVAKNTAKRLNVLSVYDYGPPPPRNAHIPTDVTAKLGEDEVQRTDSDMLHRMDEYTAPLIVEGLKVEKILRVGNAREVIVQVATELQADLLIIGSHSRRGILDIMLGGTAQHVTRHAPCSVVLVSPKR
jgi:nucleotide-binding universal stress UspA family protein